MLLAPSTDNVQDLINVCQVYAAKHDIVYNTTKTECTVVPPTRSKVNHPESAQYSGRALTFVDKFTYLGHVLSHYMTDDADTRKQTTKLTVTGNTLLWKFSHCSLKVKLELVRSHCYSFYCNSLWSIWNVLGYVTMTSLRVASVATQMDHLIPGLHQEWGEKSGCDPLTLRVQHEE